jgi:hypothetical protein
MPFFIRWFPGFRVSGPSDGLLSKTDQMGKYSVMHFKGSSGTFPGRTDAMLDSGFFRVAMPSRDRFWFDPF